MIDNLKLVVKNMINGCEIDLKLEWFLIVIQIQKRARKSYNNVTRQGKVIAEQTHPQVKWALQHTYGGDVAVTT